MPFRIKSLIWGILTAFILQYHLLLGYSYHPNGNETVFSSQENRLFGVIQPAHYLSTVNVFYSINNLLIQRIR